MSPEQCLGETLDERSDLFSVGSLLYELLTHQRAYPGETVTSVIYQVLHDTPVPPSDVSSNVPPDVSDAVMKSMQKSREKRFSSGEEMAKALLSPVFPSNIDEPDTLVMTQEAVSRPLPFRWLQISRWQVTGLTAMLLVVVGMSFYFSKNQTVKEVRSAPSPSVSEGLIVLSTMPSGADILINGDLKGVSPLSLRLPPGAHDLIVSKEGYYSLEATLDSPSGKEVPIKLRLMPEDLP
ncbi:MAG: serine/threonine protein kinase [Nitrospiria bacterium]